MELLNDYECEIKYHPGKANVVADALSRKVNTKVPRARISHLQVRISLRDCFLEDQEKAFEGKNIENEALCGMEMRFDKDDEGILYFKGRAWVPKVNGLRDVFMNEAYNTKYSIHPGADKMYQGLKMDFWWPRMKGDVARYVSRFMTSHFIPIKEDRDTERLARLYVEKIVTLHETGERSLATVDFVQETTEKVAIIKEKLKAARDWQKSYADQRRKPLEFEVGDKVLLKVLPWKGTVRFGKRGKLCPRYIGPFEIVARIGPVAYKLKLPQDLGDVHDTFHVSNLKKCLADDSKVVLLEELGVEDKLQIHEEPIEVLDRDEKRLKRNKIPIVKVRWDTRRGPEFTLEREDFCH
uniref:uncharacterized protein LOC122596972 n=1 Tax=Erigeron canadensis TaxID=72917 RepID=UPI001CB997E3|nr:uncharacterized protein LOC122596972 [Erigeron canadensis]